MLQMYVMDIYLQNSLPGVCKKKKQQMTLTKAGGFLFLGLVFANAPLLFILVLHPKSHLGLPQNRFEHKSLLK